MNTYFHFACVREENGKCAACYVRVHSSENLATRFNGYVIAQIAPTKKHAISLAAYWNLCYQRNGTYIYEAEVSA